MGVPILFGVLFFYVVCLGCSDTIKPTVMVVAVFTLLVIAVRFKTLCERISLPFIALTLYVIMNGVSTFYAVSGKFALREFLKVFLAYLLAVVFLATSPNNEKNIGKRIATVLAVCAAIMSLVSIDLISTRWISGAVIWVLRQFTDAYEGLTGVLKNSRITSLFNNSNVFAGVSGLGLLLSIGLAHNAKETKRERSFYITLAYINLLAFILAMSMGAIFFMALALVGFLAIEQQKKRIHLLLLLLEIFVFAGISTALISKTSFDVWTHPRFVPICCVIVGSAAVCFIDAQQRKRITIRETPGTKKLVWIPIAFVALVAIYAVAAWNLTIGVTVSPGEVFRRTIYPDPGTYTLKLQSDGGPIHVVIWSQNQQDILLYHDNHLYSGDYTNEDESEIVFTVPDDTKVVYFQFTMDQETYIQSAYCGRYKIPLRYALLPEFAANRIQGLFANQNSARRTVYFRDGQKLFRRSPIIGLGMGGFENGIKSVQSIYYETKYAHNHYFQTMLETGLIGLILFLFLLITSASAIWKSRKTQTFSSALGAVLLFIAGQAIHDIILSSYAYLPLAYGGFVLINLCCGKPLTKPKLSRPAKMAFVGIAASCMIVFCAFLSGNLAAVYYMNHNPSMQTLTRCIELDKFEWADYALSYVVNTNGDNVNHYVRQQADIYAERLAKEDSNVIPLYLAEYYFGSDRSEQAIDMIEKYVDYVSSDQSAWQRAFDMLQTYDDGSELYHERVLMIKEKLDTWNRENLGSITLNDDTQAYIAGGLH